MTDHETETTDTDEQAIERAMRELARELARKGIGR